MTLDEWAIAKLYVGYFNRAPDRDGFNYWISRAAAGMPVLDIANSFFVQPEAQAIYGNLTPVNLVSLIYANLLRRTPDREGLNYWLNELANGKPVGRMIIDIISGAQGADAVLINDLAQAGYEWMKQSPNIFDIAEARLAISRVNNWPTPDGANVTIVPAELQPYAGVIIPAVQRAWAQWGLPGGIEIEVLADATALLPRQLAMAAPVMECHTGDSGVEREVQSGLDPNGALVDGRIYITAEISSLINLYDLESLMAHEIGHFFFRPGNNHLAPNSYSRLISVAGGLPVLSGPNIIAAYGGPIPLQVDANNRPLPHVADGRMIMYPYFNHHEVRRVSAWDKAVLRDMGMNPN